MLTPEIISQKPVFAIIRRTSDGLFYNPTTKDFEANGLVCIDMVNDGENELIWRSAAPINLPVGFYTIYYYDEVGLVKRENVSGESNVIEDMAKRVAKIEILSKISRQLDEVLQLLKASPLDKSL